MESAERNEIHSFGDWIQRRRQGLGLTRADLAQKVGCAVITIKKIERDERRPSAQIAELLADYLVIPDDLRGEFLQVARGYFSISSNGAIQELRIPTFIQQATPFTQDQAVHFVDRPSELDTLEIHLRQTLAGDGLPVFIFGEAGSGKTTLMTEFARRAQEMDPELIVAVGQCNAQSGLGDPYRPFRDILSMLTGDMETSLVLGGINRQQALRIWSAIPDMMRTITVYGPNLVNLFLPVKPLIRRLADYLTGPADWLDQIQTLAQPDRLKRAQLEQNQVLEEITQVLRAFSVHHPLLLILDDLQWVDDASKNLLYHLGRRLSGSRILLLGACRLGEMTANRLSEPAAVVETHPIQSLIRELSRHYGNIQINLNNTAASEGRAFIDALLDYEPNHLDRAFRDTLFRYTQGQPLFTIEMIRNLQENRALVQDDGGSWTVNKAWQASPLPARIEALIAQRLESLPTALLDLLRIASVEGNVFTAEVLSGILAMDPGLVLQHLSRDLEMRYRLVQDQGEIQVGTPRLNRFQFRHVLFQEYLYAQLSDGEKRRLHRAVAEGLEKALLLPAESEELAGPERLDPFGPALAHHFWAGEVWDKAAAYALVAGKQARASYAMREAISYFEQALSALDHQTEPPYARIFETILCWQETAFNYRPYEEQLHRLARAEAIAREHQDKPRLIQALHSTANVFLSRGLWTRAGPALTECLALSEELDNEQLSVRPTFFKGLMTSFADPTLSLNWIDQALQLAGKYNDQPIEASALGIKGQVLAQLGEFAQSQQAIQRAQQVANQLGSPLVESDVDLLAAWASLAKGDLQQALELGQRSVAKAIATDNMDCICSGLACIGYGNLELQRIPEAVSAFERGIERSNISGAIIPLLNGQAGLAMAQFYSGRLEAIEDLEGVVAKMNLYEHYVGAANANFMLGMCLFQLGLLDRAETHITNAVDYYRRSQMRPFLARTLSGLTALLEKQGRLSEAQKNRAEAESIMQKFTTAG